MGVPAIAETSLLLGTEEPAQSLRPIVDLVGEVVTQKRHLLEEAKQNRFTGTSLIGEGTTILSDVSTVGFSVVQGISHLITPTAGLLLFGSISGVIGGVLNIGQGVYVLGFAIRSFLNKQRKQGARLLFDASLLIGIGLFMSLISLSVLGLKLGAIGAVAANPYVLAIVIPILFLILTLPCLAQIGDYIKSIKNKKDTPSQLKLDEIDLADKRKLIAERPLFQKMARLSGSNEENTEVISDTMEKLAEEIGVEAAIEVLELTRLILENQEEAKEEERITKQIEICRQKIAHWNQAVALRTAQLLMYAATAPLALISIPLASTASKVVIAASKFFLTIPSILGAYMDTCKPFTRNSVYVVPKVAG